MLVRDQERASRNADVEQRQVVHSRRIKLAHALAKGFRKMTGRPVSDCAILVRRTQLSFSQGSTDQLTSKATKGQHQLWLVCVEQLRNQFHRGRKDIPFPGFPLWIDELRRVHRIAHVQSLVIEPQSIGKHGARSDIQDGRTDVVPRRMETGRETQTEWNGASRCEKVNRR